MKTETQTPITELLPNWKPGKPRTTPEEIKAANDSLTRTLLETKWIPDGPDKTVPAEPINASSESP